MRMSIWLRTVLVMNAFVLVLALVLGWIAQDMAGRVVEERFAKEMVTGVSGFLKDKSLPLSNAMMLYLRDLFQADWVATEGSGGVPVASSLSAAATREFRTEVGQVGTSGVIRLGGAVFRMDSAAVGLPDATTGRVGSCRLFMLVPYAQFQQARARAARRVGGVVLPAAVAATLLATLLAFTVTRPIRRLADEMDRLAADAATGTDTAAAVPGGARPPFAEPAEVSRLAASFHGLIERLGAARQRLAQQERLAALGKVSLSVAHELRNPLSGIKMNVRVLRDSLGRGADDPGLDAIARELDRMGLYLDELLQLAPGHDPAARPLTPAPVRLSALADSVLSILAGRCRHAQIAVQRDYPAAEPAVMADADQVRQVLMNLLVNAIEAMATGGTLTVAVRPQGAAVRCTVQDTGPGVQCAPGQDIFAAFVTGKPNGVGLGLYLCRQAMARHGGRLGYDSSAGGARFWFELPVAAAAGPEPPSPRSAEEGRRP